MNVPETMKYFCISESVAKYLQKYIQYRKRKIFFGETNKLEDLMKYVTKHIGEKFLVAVSDVHDVNKAVEEQKDDILSLMEKAGANFTPAVMYKTVSTDFTKEPDFSYDMLVFFCRPR